MFSASRRSARLSQICVPKIGIQTGPFGSQLHSSDYVSDGTPIITVENLGENRIDARSVPMVSPEDAERLSRYRLEPGDIVFSRVGSVDRRALVRVGEDGWLFSGRCLRVRPNPSMVDPEFLSYFFGLNGFKEHVRAIAVGATMPSINTEILSNLEILLPPLPEQRAIAEVLGALDDKIESNMRLMMLGASLIQAEFDSLGSSSDSWTCLRDLISSPRGAVQTGPFGSNLHASDYAEHGIPLLLVKHISNGSVRHEDLPLVSFEKARELESYKLCLHDIVITRVGRVGDAALIGTAEVGWLFSGQMLRIKVEACGLDPFWLASWFLSPAFKDVINGYAVGSTRQSLSTGILLEVPMPKVTIESQHQFRKVVEPIQSMIWSSRTESTKLSCLRDSLLSELLSGRLRASEAIDLMESS